MNFFPLGEERTKKNFTHLPLIFGARPVCEVPHSIFVGVYINFFYKNMC